MGMHRFDLDHTLGKCTQGNGWYLRNLGVGEVFHSITNCHWRGIVIFVLEEIEVYGRKHSEGQSCFTQMQEVEGGGGGSGKM